MWIATISKQLPSFNVIYWAVFPGMCKSPNQCFWKSHVLDSGGLAGVTGSTLTISILLMFLQWETPDREPRVTKARDSFAHCSPPTNYFWFLPWEHLCSLILIPTEEPTSAKNGWGSTPTCTPGKAHRALPRASAQPTSCNRQPSGSALPSWSLMDCPVHIGAAGSPISD